MRIATFDLRLAVLAAGFQFDIFKGKVCGSECAFGGNLSDRE
jgi:hypothetical protein